jgi:ubiquinone/menaquinone biosynthesis C-methylase UbiE
LKVSEPRIKKIEVRCFKRAAPFAVSNKSAQNYEQYIVQLVITPHTHAVLDHMPLQKGNRVLDVACGTGIVTRIAAERFDNIGKIVGLDRNPAMLDIARQSNPSNIPVEWHEGDMCALPFPDDSFDVVFCQQGMQYVQDKLAALREMDRVLVSGGRLAFTVWSAPHPHAAAFAEALRSHVSDEAATNALSASSWGDPEVIRNVVGEVGFRTVEMDVIQSMGRLSSSADAVSSWVAYQGSRSSFASEIENSLTAISQDVSDALQVYREGDEFVIPSQAHLVRAVTA